MKKIIITAIALLVAGSMAFAQENVYTITSGNVKMTVDAGQGGKIMSLKYGDQEVISQFKFPNAFGSTFWTSPQTEWNWPPVPEIDSMPYSVEEKDGHIIMTSQLGEKIPMRIIKNFSVDPADGAIVIKYSIVNCSAATRSVAPWEITRVPNGGVVFFESPVKKIWPAGLMDFKGKAGAAWFQIDQAKENRKTNADGAGWLAFADNGLLLVKEFDDITVKDPAPGEAEIQVYVNFGKTYVELESQGAYKALEPGENLDWTVRWHLVPFEGEASPSKALVKKVKALL